MKSLLIGLCVCTVSLFQGCTRDADVVSRNLSEDADNFKIERRIVFYNSDYDSYILTIQGLCSFNAETDKKVSVTCKVGEGQYKKHTLGLSDSVTYFSEQLDSNNVSASQYKVTFKPTTILSTVEVR